MAIQQSSNSAIVSWKGFSIGADSSVDIRQPSSTSAILNRVTGATPSTIAGRLTANGQVYLVNPNGIAITRSGNVQAGAFVASTLDIADDDFLAGRREFRGDGRATTVRNEGAIEIGRGGYAALLGGRVDNSGIVDVPLGRIGLGAGELVTLDLSGDGFLSVAVPPQGTTADVLIQSSGRLSADGGRIEISAATARQVARHAVNLSGVVEARTISGRSGQIVLSGGPGGSVTVSGRLDASATEPEAGPPAAPPLPAARPTGGGIDLVGADVRLSGATLDASGPAGGGTIRIGGDYKGGAALPRARAASVDAQTRIAADATQAGDGGRIILWSDGLTTFDGAISARGGPSGGDGGFSEVSGKGRLVFAGQVDLSAAAGAAGTLLLDPFNVVVVEGASPDPDVPPCCDEPSGNDTVLFAGDIEAALADLNVIISTGTISDEGDPQSGVITIDAGLTWSSGQTLTLDAADDIIVNEAITILSNGDGVAGALAMNAGDAIALNAAITGGEILVDAGGAISTGPAASLNVDAFLLLGGNWVQDGPDLPDFNAADFGLSETASFRRTVGGTGTSGDPYLVADVYGLQGIDTAGYDDQSFALANEIDASGTANWNDGIGFNPIGEFDLAATPFSGGFDGQGHVISGLVIDQSASEGQTEPAGLFGVVEGGADIRNVGLVDVSIIGISQAGALVGSLSTDSLVENVLVAGGSVSGDDNVGGLIGEHVSSEVIVGQPEVPLFTIRSAAADVSVSGNTNVGGLVGLNEGAIEQVFSVGSVDGFAAVGGLVGQNSGSITLAYAKGVVDGSFDVGGLVGENTGSVSESYATGLVTGGSGNDFSHGGLVGFDNDGELSTSFWDTQTTGQSQGEGFSTDEADAGTGLTTAAFQATEGFVELAGPQGWDFEQDWAPPQPGFYPALYALEPVIRVVAPNTTAVRGSAQQLTPGGQLFGGPGIFVLGPAGDSLEVSATLSSEGIPSSTAGPFPNVGTYPITVVSSATSTGGVDYRVVATDGVLTVTPAPLIITALDAAKVYGTEFAFDGTEFSVGGLVPGDSVETVTLASEGAAAKAPVAGSTYAISPSDPQGIGLFADGIENYEIAFVPGELAVAPAPLIVRALDAVKLLGAELTFDGSEFTVEGLVPGDSVTNVTLFSEGAAAGAPLSGSPYAIFVTDPQGVGLVLDGIANYDIALVPGELALVSPADEEAAARVTPAWFAPAVELPDPGDEIVYGGGGGPIIGLPSARTDPVEAAQETLRFLEQLSGSLEGAVDACRRSEPDVEAYLDCLGTALEEYAAQIDAVAVDLPEPLRGVAATIQQASREVREARDTAVQQLATARTPAERTRIRREAAAKARAAVATATEEIRKQIALIRADEPQVARLQAEQGDAITGALDIVGRDLERVVGL
jgi:filamentous hemagglutinin family protein